MNPQDGFYVEKGQIYFALDSEGTGSSYLDGKSEISNAFPENQGIQIEMDDGQEISYFSSFFSHLSLETLESHQNEKQMS